MSSFVEKSALPGPPAPRPPGLFFRLSRDSWLAIGLFVLLAVISGISLYQQTSNQAAPPLTSYSTQPDGARALWLWLEELGYAVSDRVSSTFAIPDGTDVVVLLEPTEFIEQSEWPSLDQWVEAGGTLVIVGSSFVTDQAFAHFDFDISLRPSQVSQIAQQNPLMVSPPAEPLPLAGNLLTLQTGRDDYVTHFAIGSGPVVVSFVQGNGRILLTTLSEPFTNKGLQEAGYPQFVLNLLGIAGEAGSVWFDEWHHGVRVQDNQIAGIGAWLRRTPLGRAFVFMAIVIFVAVVLQGRPFGRPVPLPHESSRRAPLEYITALANLSRRAGHRTAVLQDYHHRLKKSIGHRYRLNPTLPDDEFLAHLADYTPNLDLVTLRSLLQRLSVATIGETEMIQLAAEVSDWLK